MNFNFPMLVPTHLSALVPNACEEGLQLMISLLHWDPKARPTANKVSEYTIESQFYNYFPQ